MKILDPCCRCAPILLPSPLLPSPCLARTKTIMGWQWVQQRANTPLLRQWMRESRRTEGSRRGGKEERGRGGTTDGEGKCGESGGAARQRDEKKDWATELGQRGTLGYIVSLIPDTSGSIPDTSSIRGLAQFIPKCVFSLPIPFSVIS